MSRQAWWHVVSTGSVRIGNREDQVLDGTARNDILAGLGGNDVLRGLGGNDLLYGGAGHDLLIGGVGSDLLAGGLGSDTFQFDLPDSTAAKADTIVDFRRGEDLIDLRPLLGGFDAATGADSVQLAWGGTTPTARGVWFEKDLVHKVTYVRADVDGAPGTTELVIRLIGLHELTADDFLGVGAANTPPVAQEDKSLVVAEDSGDTPLDISAPTDAEGGPLRITVDEVPDATVGSVHLENGAALAAGTELTGLELASLVFRPALNASGDVSFKYTVTDSAGASDSQTIAIAVTPVADAPTVTVENATGNEDSSIPLSIQAAVSDASETLTHVEIRGVPVGASLSHGERAADGSSYIVQAQHLPSLTLTPAAHSDADITLSVKAFSAEGSSVAESAAVPLSVQVNPVVDGPIVTVSPAFGIEDFAVGLSISVQHLDTDGSETSVIRIGGLQGAKLSAGTENGDGSWTLTQAQLPGLTLQAAPNFSGTIPLTIQVTTTELGGGSLTGFAPPTTVFIEAVADQPTLQTSTSRGVAGAPIPLHIPAALTDTDGSEALWVRISGLPAGATLSAGTLNPADGSYMIAGSQLSGLSVTTAPGTVGLFELRAEALAVEGTNGRTASSLPQPIFVDVLPPRFGGIALDGYLVGSTVFADVDGDGVRDAGEASTLTSANGSFVLEGTVGAPLVLTGGTDVSTGLPFQGTLRAPGGSTVLTPLTTLIVELMATGLSADAAEARIEQAFRLPSGISLGIYDPIRAAQAGASEGLAIYAAGTQVQNTIALAAALLEGAGATQAAAADAVIAALAQQIATTDNLQLKELITAAAENTGVNVSNETAEGAAQVIAALNAAVDKAATTQTGLGALTEIAQASLVAQSDAAAAMEAAGSTGNTQAIVANFTGAALDAAIAAAESKVGYAGVVQAGTSGPDVFAGTPNDDAFDGLAGNDNISGAGGNDFLFGNVGDDTLRGGPGADYLDGGTTPGNPVELDTVSYDYAGSGVSVDLAARTASVSGDPGDQDRLFNFEAVTGTSFNDTLKGGNPANDDFERFEPLGGNDSIDGGSGFDEVYYGNAPAGIVVNLALHGGEVSNDGYGGVDTLTNIDSVFGSRFADSLTGDEGPNRLRGMGGADILDGGAGVDEADYRAPTVFLPQAVVMVNLHPTITFNFNGEMLAPLSARDGHGSIDTLISIEQARGSQGNDAFAGNSEANRFRGEGGNDFFIGGAGDDLIEGGENPAGQPADFDTVHYDLASAVAGVTVNLGTGIAFDGFGGTDTLVDIEQVNGSRFDDVLIGGNVSNGSPVGLIEAFDGRGGNDYIDGGGGSDRVIYQFAPAAVIVDLQAGTAIGGYLTATGAATTDTLVAIERVRGTSQADTMRGSNNAFNDIYSTEVFEGLAGDDFIDGRGGLDMAEYILSPGPVAVNLSAIARSTALGMVAAGSALDGFGTTDTLVNIEQARGTFGNDFFYGSDTNVLIESFDPLGGSDFIDGGGGIDMIRYASLPTSVFVDLSLGTVREGFSNLVSDTFVNIEGVTGSAFNDTLLGGNPANDGLEIFEGFAGNDFISGMSGHDRAEYRASPGGINVNLAAETAQDGWGGTDTLHYIEEVSGSYHADIMVGSAADETFIGRAGNDSIDGAGGIDTASYYQADAGVTVHLSTGRASDGEGGTDTLTSIERVVGSEYGDVLTGTRAADVLEGGAGADTLWGGQGDDRLLGGAGDDLIYEDAGADHIDGGAGADTLSREHATGGAVVNLGFAGGPDTLLGIENVTGSAFADSLLGNGNDNVLSGLDGSDFIIGADGNDRLFGGLGNDTLDGGRGNNHLDGGTGFQPGPDLGSDFDLANYSDAVGGIEVNLRLGTARSLDMALGGVNDTLVGIEALMGSGGNDSLTGGNVANDDFERFDGNAGMDTIDGGTGFDEASYALAFSGVTVDLALNSAASDGYGTSDTLLNIEALLGSTHGDTLSGDAGNNRFRGLAGADTLDGRAGVDEVDYRQFFANGVPQQVTGVVANLGDVATAAFNVAAPNMAPVMVSAAAGTARDGSTAVGGAVDTLVSIENLRGSDFNDMLVGSAGENWLRGEGGDDLLIGNAGNDRLEGGLSGNDTLVGGAGNDVIAGGDNRPGLLSDFDTLDYLAENGGAGVSVDLGAGTATDSFGDTDTVAGIEVVIGTHHDDTLRGGDAGNAGPFASETFMGRGGNDLIVGGVTNNWADYRNAAGGIRADLAGVVEVDGDGGSDTLVNINRLRGSRFDDKLFGTDNATGDERFEGMDGNDQIDGRGGIDYVEYGLSSFAVNVDLGARIAHGVGAQGVPEGPGAGSDNFVNIEGVGGSRFADFLYGSLDNDFFEGRAGNDFIHGREGFDRAEYTRSGSGVFANLATGSASDGNGGTDTLVSIEALRGSMFNDTLIGDAGDNVLEGREGNDFLVGGAGSDTLDGGENPRTVVSDFDTISYFQDGGSSGVHVDFALGTARDGFGAIDIVRNVEAVRGTQFADTLLGGNPQNRATSEQFEGRGGHDLIDGRGGLDAAQYINAAAGVHADLAAGRAFDDGDGASDTLVSIEWLRGSAFDDRLYGSDTPEFGSERFEGMAGNDYIDGRGGFDYLIFQSAQTGITVDLARGWTADGQGGIDLFFNIEAVRGTNFADSLFGTDASGVTEAFEGAGGSDFIDGRGGRDRLEFSRSEAAVDVNLATGVASDGFGAFDRFVNIEDANGSVFNDVLIGDGGTNLLNGRDGNDLLTGNGGDDIFVFSQPILDSALPGMDTVTDFGAGDRLDVRDLLLGFTPGSSPLEDYVRWSTDATGTTVALDRDGSGSAHSFEDIVKLERFAATSADDFGFVF